MDDHEEIPGHDTGGLGGHRPITESHETQRREACYTELKRAVYHAYPFFDEAALDAAHLIYGCPAEKVLWQDGKMTID